jgi:DNA-binding transcriptional LysR family regulator
MLFAFQDARPEIQLEITETSSSAALAAMKADPTAAAIVFSSPEGRVEPQDEAFTLCRDRLMLLAREGHALAGRESVLLADLKNENIQILQRAQEATLYSLIVEQCRKKGFEPKITGSELWVNNFSDVLQHSDAVSILPGRIAEELDEADIRLVPIEDADALLVSVLRHKENRSAAMRAFWEYVQRYARAHL